MKQLYSIILLLSVSFCYPQNDSSFYYFDRVTPINKIESKIENTTDVSIKNYYKLVYYCKIRNLDSIKKFIKVLEKNKNLSEKKRIRLLYFTAFYHKISQNDSLRFKFHREAYESALKIDDTLTILYAVNGLAQSYDYENDRSYRLDYLNLLEEYAYKFSNTKFKIVHSYLKGNYYLFRDKYIQAAESLNSTLDFKFSKSDSILLINTLNSLGTLYNGKLNIPDSAIYYYKRKLQIIEANKVYQYPSNYFVTYINIGNAYLKKNELDNALHYFKRADSIKLNEDQLFYERSIQERLSIVFERKKQFKKAYESLFNYNKLNDSINNNKHRKAIASYENEKLRADNLESETKRLAIENKQKDTDAKRKRNLNIAIGLGSTLVAGFIIFFLLQKNTKRKQKLAVQAKEIESQKLATVLKEQELIAIDAMIEGQEKERQRIANDLHDDLGGLMATVKLHFNALKDKGSEELYDKTSELIDNAYDKVRSVAHAKNSGVIAKDGLLKSVRHMADKVSNSNQLKIDVVDHGLEQRLENSLELTLFRIIQEFTTNIIKHADATEATIYLTQHEDRLNIMVEDNGKGFNPSQVTKKKAGMGISSIDKRVAHLEGCMTIESEPKKGTTIIIDIPV